MDDRQRALLRAALEKSPVFGSDGLPAQLAAGDAFSLHCCAAGEGFQIGGDDGSCALGLVVDGEVSVCRDDSQRNVTLNVLHPGDCFGASALFSDGTSPSHSVTRIEAAKEAVVAFISETRLRRLLTSNPSLCISYITFLTGRIRFLNSKLYTFSGGTTVEKVAKLLLSQHRETGCCSADNCAELARRLNIGRASLYRALDSLEKQGIIHREGQRIEILDKARMSEVR